MRAEWDLTMEKPVLNLSVISGVLWTKDLDGSSDPISEIYAEKEKLLRLFLQ